jgi:hypothetical protein
MIGVPRGKIEYKEGKKGCREDEEGEEEESTGMTGKKKMGKETLEQAPRQALARTRVRSMYVRSSKQPL